MHAVSDTSALSGVIELIMMLRGAASWHQRLRDDRRRHLTFTWPLGFMAGFALTRDYMKPPIIGEAFDIFILRHPLGMKATLIATSSVVVK